MTTNLLSDVRYRFIVSSHRRDLITGGDLSTNADDGANWYINAGIRYLDHIIGHNQKTARFNYAMSIGDYYRLFTDLEDVLRVVFKKADGTAIDFSTCTNSGAMTIRDFREAYSGAASLWESGDPVAWARTVIRRRGSTDYSGDGILDYADTSATDTDAYGNIQLIWYPKLEEAMTLEVWGHAKEDNLSDDGDYNFWTTEHPDLVVAAAMRMVHVDMNNKSGVAAQEAYIMPMLDKIDSRQVEQELSDYPDMRIQR